MNLQNFGSFFRNYSYTKKTVPGFRHGVGAGITRKRVPERNFAGILRIPVRIATLGFRYASVCKKMGLKYVKGDKFGKGNEDKWPKHKATAVKDNKKEDTDD